MFKAGCRSCDRVLNALDSGFFTVRIYHSAILDVVGQRTGAVDTAAYAGHALDKVAGGLALGGPEQCDAAFLKAAAAGGFSLEVQALLLDCLGGSLGQTAAMAKIRP